MKSLEEKYKQQLSNQGDMHPFLPTLKEYGSKCNHITEMGFRRGVSTWGLLASEPKTLISYDISSCNSNEHESFSVSDFKLVKANTLEIEIEETDLLFIDTDHQYKQLRMELDLHSKNVKKYIIIHDTILFGKEDAPWTPDKYDDYKHLLDKYPEGKGLIAAINDFLKETNEWEIHKIYEDHKGLTILRRKE